MTYREHMRRSAYQYLSDTLRDSGGVISRAAKTAGITRWNFYTLLDKHGVERQRRLNRGNGVWQTLDEQSPCTTPEK
jgi:DNA-binding NtrC family response regulator